MSKRSLKSAMESMLFVWGQPLSVKDIASACDITEKEATECLQELQQEYEQENRGIRIRKVGRAYQFTTDAENEGYVRRLCTPVKIKRLSQAALEVLAIVAYRQPVTKGEIDAIRGVKCDRVIEGLVQKNLVKNKGRSEGVGRPILYGTTDVFLQHFGFGSLKELPEIGDIEDLISMVEEDDAPEVPEETPVREGEEDASRDN